MEIQTWLEVRVPWASSSAAWWAAQVAGEFWKLLYPQPF